MPSRLIPLTISALMVLSPAANFSAAEGDMETVTPFSPFRLVYVFTRTQSGFFSFAIHAPFHCLVDVRHTHRTCPHDFSSTPISLAATLASSFVFAPEVVDVTDVPVLYGDAAPLATPDPLIVKHVLPYLPDRLGVRQWCGYTEPPPASAVGAPHHALV